MKLCIVVSCLAAAFVATAGIRSASWSSRATIRGGDEAERILAESRRICRVLNPSAPEITLTVERLSDHWLVCCIDEAEACQITLFWSAQHERLWQVVHSHPRRGMAGAPPMGPRAARVAVSQWIRQLGITGPTLEWRVGGHPVERSGRWTFRWWADGRLVSAIVDDRTGDLVEAGLADSPGSLTFHGRTNQ